MKQVTAAAVALFVIFAFGSQKTAKAQTYVGSDTCIGCHQGINPTLVANYLKSGHPYKLNEVNGAPPVYPDGTSPGVPTPPPRTTWDEFAYVIGGYGWKARWVYKNGLIYTASDSAQFNLDDGSWVPYHLGEDKPYNFACFKCHTTAPSPEGSWNGVPDDSLGTFGEPGIRCEGCHGPGSDHAADPTGTPPPNTDLTLQVTRCGECHNRSDVATTIPVSGGFIRHHEQFNEFSTSKHGDGVGADLSCASCHDPHVPLRYEDAAEPGTAGFKTTCETCHPNHEIALDAGIKTAECVDCHMPEATKSALGVQVGNGWKGDLPTHIFAINTDPVTKDVGMFTADGSAVKLDADNHAAVTLDFACLGCHTDKTVDWASPFAKGIHENGIVTATESEDMLPKAFTLEQNYPNPFNPSTTIRFAVPEVRHVTLKLFNITGQEVGTLIDATMPTGNHSVTIDASSLASGVYIYQIKAGSFVQSRVMTLAK